MVEQFEDITVTRFDVGAEDQEPEHRAVFRFKFYLSRPAPSLWVQIAAADIGETTGRVNFCIQRKAWAHRDRIVVRCTADEAQRVKDTLNSEVMPKVNMEYRRLSELQRMRDDAHNAVQAKLLDGVQAAIARQH